VRSIAWRSMRRLYPAIAIEANPANRGKWLVPMR
jgi:hypothetical protein